MEIKIFFNRAFWRRFWRIISLAEKKKLKISFLVGGLSFLIILIGWYYGATKLTPKAGGTLREAIVGQPTSFNPILGQSEADQEMMGLVFNGLLKSDGKGGTANDLAERVEMKEGGKKWTVKLKPGIFWQDGEEFRADDVLFTIRAIQNSESRSPAQSSWQGVTVTKEDDFNLTFELREPFAFFQENLKQRIAPEHIFKDIPLANLYLSDYNFQPIGTGPFIFQEFEKNKAGFITTYNFKANKNYFAGAPFLDKMELKFYKNETEAITAFNNREADLLAGVSAKGLDEISRRFAETKIVLPRYFALFFNQNINKIFADKNVLEALNYATDRQQLINDVFKGKAQMVAGPLLSDMPGYKPEFEAGFSLENAEKLLVEAGWKDEDNDGIKEKKLAKNAEPTLLSFSIVAPESAGIMEAVSFLKNQWAQIGVKVEMKIASPAELQDNYFRSRIYDSLIFGNFLNYRPDLFPFWHSSQKFYPGLNLSLYEDKTIDRLTEEARQELDEKKQAEKLGKIQAIIFEDKPAVFLCNPWFNLVALSDLNFAGSDFKLNSLGERYFNIEQWSLKTKRVFK